MVYSVSSELYLEVAARLAEAIGGENCATRSTFPFGDMECRLTASVIVYRRRERLPEGDRDAIADLVPVWWEFHTVRSDGEALNDFSFSECARSSDLPPRSGPPSPARRCRRSAPRQKTCPPRRRAWVFPKISVKCSNQPNRPLRNSSAEFP